MGQPPILRTKKQLADDATARGIPVSYWQVDEWIQDGLLPPAEPTSSGKKLRGRPRKLYGEQAFKAVCWLGEHRAHIKTGADTVRFWMWLEGFDYVQVDPSDVLLASIQRAWAEMQVDIPSLPPIDQIDHLSDRQIDQMYDSEHGSVLDQFDRYARSLENGPLGAQGQDMAWLGGALSGAIPLDALKPYDDLTEADGETITQSLTDLVVGNTESMGTSPALADIIRVSRVIDLYRAVKNGSFDLALMRRIWQALDPAVFAALTGIPLTPSMRRMFGPLTDRSALMSALRYQPGAVAEMAFAAVNTHLAEEGRANRAEK